MAGQLGTGSNSLSAAQLAAIRDLIAAAAPVRTYPTRAL